MFNEPKKTLNDLPADVKAAMQNSVHKAAELAPDAAGQIQFYIYDRGQCFNEAEEAVMAMVNWNGCAAHYLISSREKVWQFFQMPHLCNENRASKRMGYASIDAMHEDLFGQFNQYLVTIGWTAKHAPVFFAA